MTLSAQPVSWQQGSSLEALELLQQLTLTLGVQHNTSELFQKLLEGVLKFCGGSSAALYVGLDDGSLEMRYGIGALTNPVGTVFAVGEGVTGWVFKHQQALLISDYQASQFKSPRYVGMDRSLLAAPLRQGGDVFGVLTVIWEKQIGAYQQEHLMLLERFAAFTSVALENAQLRSRQERLNEEALLRAARRDELQQHLADVILRLEPLEALHELVLRCGQLLGANGGLALMRPASDRFELMLNPKNPVMGVFHGGNEGLLRRALLGSPVLVNQYLQHPDRVQSYANAGVQAVLAVALEGSQAHKGLVFFERYDARYFDKNDLELVLQIAPVLSGLLENARLYLEAHVAKSDAEQKAQLLEVIYQTYLELGHQQDIKALANSLLARVTGVLGADTGGMYLRREQEIQLIASYGDELVQQAPLGYGASGTVALTGQSLLLEDYSKSEFHHKADPGKPWHSLISVPLFRQQELIGALTLVDTRYSGRFNQADLDALARFATIASLTLENMQLLESSRRAEQRTQAQNQQLQLLHQASLTISRHAPRQILLKSLLERAATLLGANDGTIFMREADGLIRSAAHLNHDNTEPLVIDQNHGVSGKVISSGSPMLVQHYQQWDGRPSPELQPYWQSALAVPLHLEQQVVGSLTLAHTEHPNQFLAEDLITLERFAAVANVALENMSLLEATSSTAQTSKYQARLLKALHQTSLELAGQLESSVLLQQLVDRVALLFEADAGAVYLIHDDVFERVAIFGDSPSYSGKVGKGISGLVMLEQQARIVEDYRVWSGRDSLPNEPIRWRAAMSAPLWRGAEVIGALTIADTRSAKRFSGTDLEALERFAASASAALENVRLFDRQKIAEHNAKARSAQMEALHEINLELGRYTDLEPLLESIAERAVMLIEAQAGSLDLREFDSDRLREVALIGDISSRAIELGKGASGIVALTGRSLLIENYQQWEHRIDPNWQSVVSVPLKQHNQVVGTLTVAEQHRHSRFSNTDLESLERFAASASLALERARLLDDARSAESNALTRARQLEALHQVSLEVSQNLEPEALLSSILERAATLLGANVGAVFLVENDEAVIAASIGKYDISRVQLGTSVSGRVAQTGQPILVDDYQTWEGALQLPKSTWRSIASVPLKQHNNIIGALTLGDTVLTGRFRASDLESLERFASLASIALENARLYVRERANLRDERIRTRISQEVSKLRSVSDLVRAVLSVLEDSFGYRHIFVYLLEDQILRLQGQIGDSTSCFEIPMQHGVTGRVARTGVAELIKDGTTDSDFVFADPHLISMICIPLQGSQRILGTLNVEAEQPLTQNDLEMLVALSTPISTALENALLHEQIEHKVSEMEFLRFQAERAARFDPLTNLRNRRAFDEDLKRTFEQTKDKGFSLAAIDLTGFKQVNDRFGHAAGDTALARVGKALSTAPQHRGRALHKTYRTGGDEFILLIPHEQPPLELLMHITRTVEALEFSEGMKIGLNIGLATYPTEAENLDQLQSLADNRMYKAKSAGKPYLVGDDLEAQPILRRRATDR